ncbi:MAG: WhiB family transcriptional regulator [Acidimicrobiia bacterium]|nr:WhiB family transcriptional regulator [Acidimicrobiia bacterium]
MSELILQVPITEERPWLVFGACRQVESDLFFPASKAQELEALRICATCPVRDECFAHAIESREAYGVWGGTTEKQRRRLLRRTA